MEYVVIGLIIIVSYGIIILMYMRFNEHYQTDFYLWTRNRRLTNQTFRNSYRENRDVLDEGPEEKHHFLRVVIDIILGIL